MTGARRLGVRPFELSMSGERLQRPVCANISYCRRRSASGQYTSADVYQVYGAAQVWPALRESTASTALTEQQVGERVALAWHSNTTPHRSIRF